MAFKKKVHHVRHYGSRVKRRVSKAKPSVALLAGLAVGPAQIALGSGEIQGPIWSYSGNKSQELWDRITISYFGKKMSDGSSWGLSRGGYLGTAGIVVGYSAHWLASVSGLNRVLARMKLPFRI